MLSATRFSKQKRSREISLREPSVIDRVASEPLAMRTTAAMVSSTSMRLFSVAL